MDDQNQVLRVAQDDNRICHPEGCSITAGRIWLILKALNPGPSLRSGRQSGILRVAQDDTRICHPEGCSTARRIWLVLRVSKPGPSFRTTKPGPSFRTTINLK